MAGAIPRLIDRGDLLAALDRAAAGRVTIIAAPAGSGKTSLLRAWADRPGRQHRLAVMQVQRDQQDAQQFWLALLDAVRHASATTGRTGPPAATPDFNAPAMVDRVLSELADARGDITLVIDDLHELNSPEALGQLTHLLINLPPNVHAMLSTRHDLRLRLHQLRLAGELARLPRTAGPGAQQRRLPAAGRSRDDRHLPRRRVIQGSDKITPVDQPGNCWSHRQKACLGIYA